MPLKEITPARFRCAVAASCSAVFLDEATGNLVIIGRRRALEDYPQLAGRVGPGEGVVEIDTALPREALAKKIQD